MYHLLALNDFYYLIQKNLLKLGLSYTYVLKVSGSIFALPIKMKGFKIKEERFAPLNLCQNRKNIDPWCLPVLLFNVIWSFEKLSFWAFLALWLNCVGISVSRQDMKLKIRLSRDLFSEKMWQNSKLNYTWSIWLKYQPEESRT